MRNPATKSEPAPTGASASFAARPRFPVWLMAMLLLLATIALYWPATRHDFVSLDDPDYVTANVHVQNGLTLENLEWAFCNPIAGNWHPVTMLSHMLDCQLYGLKPWGHHLTSLLLHAVNTVLVFLLLRSMTGALWRSALVAALFGFHPLHVESVAWIAERKDVLSTFFGLLALVFYVRHAKPKIGNRKSEIGNYLLSLLFFTLGLMSKAMLVTMPFVMLLLDWWPLNRMRNAKCGMWNFKNLVLEKIPFFALAAATSAVTFVVQRQACSVMTVEGLALEARIGNALVSYCRYLGKTFWPADLAVYYPHPGYWPLEEVLLAGAFLCGITVLIVVKRSRYPFSLMGWLWFVGTLVPVIGLVQVGGQAMADRYTYIPSLGVLVLAIWGAHELTRRWRHQVIVLSVAASVAIVLCIAETRQQLGYWKDSESLFRHALDVTKDNYMAHNMFGSFLGMRGEIDEAIRQFQEAVRLKPAYTDAHYNLGVALFKEGQTDEAISEYQEAIRLKPDYADFHYNLGVALFKKGLTDEAMGQYQEAVRLKPEYGPAYINFANTVVINNQAWELATSPDAKVRDGTRAVRLAEQACEQTHYRMTIMLGTLAAAYAEAGRFDEAVATGQKACALASELGETNLLKRNQELVILYQAHQPYHEPPPDSNVPPIH
jgi:Tfp pilus assembly protein PilF